MQANMASPSGSDISVALRQIFVFTLAATGTTGRKT